MTLYKNVEGDKEIFGFNYHKIKPLLFISKKRYNEIIKNVYNFFIDTNKDLTKINKFYDIKNQTKIISVGGYGQVYNISNKTAIKLSYCDNNYFYEYEIPKKIISFNEVNDLIVNPYTIIKNCKFTGLLNIFQINIIIIYLIYCFIYKKEILLDEIYYKTENYDILNEYEFIFKNSKDEIREKAYNIFFYIYNTFLLVDERIYIIDCFRNLINFFKKKINDRKGYIIIMPLAECISTNAKITEIDNFIDVKNGIIPSLVYPKFYRICVLQVFLFILKINKLIFFCHNDLKPDNILIFKKYKRLTIKYEDNIFSFDNNYNFKISDFDFSIIGDLTNDKIKNTIIDKNKSWFNDIHFFIHKLFFFLKQDEINNDEMFFKALYILFIKPYCFTSFKNINKNLIIKKKDNVICHKGIFCLSNIKPNISILENFIKTDWFNEWRVDN